MVNVLTRRLVVESLLRERLHLFVDVLHGHVGRLLILLRLFTLVALLVSVDLS